MVDENKLIKPEDIEEVTQEVVTPEVTKTTTIEPTEPIARPGRQTARGNVQSKSLKELESIRSTQQKEAEAEKAVITKRAEDEREAERLDSSIERLRANIQYAQSRGLSSTALESDLQKLEADRNRLARSDEKLPELQAEQIEEPELPKEAAEQPLKAADREDMQEVAPLSQPTKQEVLQRAEDIKNETTNLQARQLAADNAIQEQRKIAQKAMERLREEDLKITAIDNDRFWKNKSTWQKIGMGLALFFGAAGGQRGNTALNVLDNLINRDIEEQKLNNKQAQAKREDAYRRVNLELNRLQDLTNDKNKIDKIEMAKQQMAAKQVQANEARLKEAQRDLMKDFIIQKKLKLENLSPSQISSIFNKEDFKNAQNLRGEYNSETRNLGTSKVISAFNRIEQAVKNPSAAGDLAMVFNFMKMLDPGSVVRESEFRNAADAGALTDRVAQKAYDQIVSGRFLSPNQRKDFKNRAAKLLKGQLKSQDMINKRYKKLARNSGIPDSLVVQEYSVNELSPREALWNKKVSANPKLKRKDFDKAVDNLIEQGKLSKKFE